MKITSWNVNGIRAVIKKGFLDFITSNNDDIFCIQETKAFETQIPKELNLIYDKYSYIWHNGTRPGYSGVATFYKNNLSTINNNELSFSETFKQDGRIIQSNFDKFILFNIYFPNGGTKANGEEMVTPKLEFYNNLISYINKLREDGNEIIITGDFNIAHREIDLARPKENKDSVGFLPIEREQIDLLIENNYVDAFRYIHGDIENKYTWWSYRAGARPRNVGWRIDYFFVSEGLLGNIKDVYHQDNIMGSDHCPITLELNFDI